MEEYKTVKVLASGQFGQTILVKDNDNKQYVLKKIKKDGIVVKFRNKTIILNNSDVYQLFIEEVEFLKRINELDTDYFPKYYGNFEDANYYILVMEYVDGYTLDQAIRNVNITSAIQWVDDLVDMFLVLAQNGLVYFDLNRQNFIVQKNNSIKLIDYGLSCQVNSRGKILNCGDELIQKIYPEVSVKNMLLLVANLIYYIVLSTPTSNSNIYEFRGLILAYMKNRGYFYTLLDPNSNGDQNKMLDKMTEKEVSIYLDLIPDTLKDYL